MCVYERGKEGEASRYQAFINNISTALSYWLKFLIFAKGLCNSARKIFSHGRFFLIFCKIVYCKQVNQKST